MKNIFLAMNLLLGISFSGVAFSETNETQFSGMTKLGLNFTKFVNFRGHVEVLDVIEVNMNAILIETSTNKGTLLISTESTKHCAGLSAKFFLEDNGFGTFDVYQSKEAWTKGVSIGSLSYNKNEINFQLLDFSFSVITASDNASYEHCYWKLGQNFNAKLKLKK